MASIQQSVKSKVNSFKSLNHNVKLLLIFTFTQSIGRSIWMGNVLSTIIYLLSESSPEMLGYASGATGITMTIVVFPSGYFADKIRRDWMLRIAAICGIFSIGILFFADTIILIFVALIIWGLYQGITRPSLEAIFADSVQSGTRSLIYSWRQLISQIGMALGPILNIFLFLLLGDEWDLDILKFVMGFGLIFSFGSLIMMFFFNDKKSLGSSSDSIEFNNDVDVILNLNNKSNNSSSEENTKSNPKSNLESKTELKTKLKFIPVKYIPYILVGCNVIIGLGAGMTVKFFTIFFMEIYTMSPIMVQIISGLTSIATGFSGLIAQHFSKAKGRPQMIFLVQAIATICLIIIATYPPMWVLIIIFITRGSLMNAAQPLSRSILMDFVPKNKRGKWNSLEALAWGLFWNVSAVVGGILIGPTHNFRLNFLVTAGIYIFGTLPIVLLFGNVSKEKN
ncbi:MFS transporter [Promethearchaeum syntrophicum]|uniref:MFS transporter n=1 Tax=Promethearchaeum syntrophicum TaxID=2594042 RepID=A0A5B9DDL6_9ARCH|nr:MFS transporter [Candidatus Prometheoarchaeum syntrophicum]